MYESRCIFGKGKKQRRIDDHVMESKSYLMDLLKEKKSHSESFEWLRVAASGSEWMRMAFSPLLYRLQHFLNCAGFYEIGRDLHELVRK